MTPIGAILDELATRLATVEGLSIREDIKQVNQKSIPCLIIDCSSEEPKDDNYKMSTKYVATLMIEIDCYADSKASLLSFVEKIEQALAVHKTIPNTLDIQYSGWTKQDAEIGSSVCGARFSLAVNYVKSL